LVSIWRKVNTNDFTTATMNVVVPQSKNIPGLLLSSFIEPEL
jgi:hypothetical protein